MRDIVFYDFDFNRLADFNKFVSLNFEQRYCGFGTAELHYSLENSEIITLLEENPYVFFMAEQLSAVVTGWKIDEDIAIYARTPEWLLSKRGIGEFSKSGVSSEVIARELVMSAAGDFVMLGELKNVGDITDYSNDEVKVLHDVIKDVLDSQKLGFRLVPEIEQKKFVFEVFEGNDSSCILSLSNRTAYDTQYFVDIQKKVDGCGWYKRKFVDKGTWDAQSNEPGISDKNTDNAYTFYKITSESYDSLGNNVIRFGLWCRKDAYLVSDSADGKWKISTSRPDTIWIRLGTPGETGAKYWEAVLDGVMTEDEARSKILKLVRNENSQAEAKGLEYGSEYRLGDIIRTQFEFGDFRKAEKKRVVAVNIYYDTDRMGVIPILENLEGYDGDKI